MSKKEYSRHSSIKQNAIIGAALGTCATSSLFATGLSGIDTPAILGGSPVRTKGWPKWPVWNSKTDEKRVLEVLRSGVWSRAKVVVENACQAWLAEINHQKVGTFGNAGCFSFQNSKNIPIGEGGAIVSNGEEFMDRCYSYHNYGDPYGTASARPGVKLRMTEYQAAIGLSQLNRLESQTNIRIGNAEYLKSQVKDIPGITPYKLYDNVTRAAFHHFPFRYKKEAFQGLPKAEFLKALKAEGIPCASGYTPLNTALNLGNTFQTKNYQKMYPKEMLDMNRYIAQNQCPKNDYLCSDEAVWFTQNMLLADKSDMKDISNAIDRIQKNAGNIKKLTENK